MLMFIYLIMWKTFMKLIQKYIYYLTCIILLILALVKIITYF